MSTQQAESMHRACTEHTDGCVEHAERLHGTCKRVCTRHAERACSHREQSQSVWKDMHGVCRESPQSVQRDMYEVCRMQAERADVHRDQSEHAARARRESRHSALRTITEHAENACGEHGESVQLRLHGLCGDCRHGERGESMHRVCRACMETAGVKACRKSVERAQSMQGGA